MNYAFTAVLIILFCLLAFFVRPPWQAPLKIDQKDYIIPPPKPKINEQQTFKYWRRSAGTDADEDGSQPDRACRNGRVRLYGADGEVGIVRDIT